MKNILTQLYTYLCMRQLEDSLYRKLILNFTVFKYLFYTSFLRKAMFLFLNK